MGAKNARGIWIPTAGDGLIEAWATMAAQLGVGIPVASVEAAAEMLDAAQSAGIGASDSAPMTFLVGSGARRVQYTADGSKAPSGKWNLHSVNQVETKDDTYNTAWSGYKDFSVLAQTQSGMMTSSLPVAPYDRRVTAQVATFGQRKAGAPMLRLRVHDGRMTYGRFDNDPNTVTCPALSFDVPANETPSITVALHGGSSSGTDTVSLSGDERMSALMVTAFPISMQI